MAPHKNDATLDIGKYYGENNPIIMKIGVNQEMKLQRIRTEMRAAEDLFKRSRDANYCIIEDTGTDWFSSPTMGASNGKYFVPDQEKDNFRQSLYDLYELDIPSMMCETVTKEFKFFISLEICSQTQTTTTSTPLEMERFYNVNSPLVSTIMESVLEAFPSKKLEDINDKKVLKCAVCASSVKPGKAPRKRTVRFSFNTIKTNSENAEKLRNSICNKLNKRTADVKHPLHEGLAALLQEAKDHHQENGSWEQMIPGANAYKEKVSRVLMLYNDLSNVHNKPSGCPLHPVSGFKCAMNAKGETLVAEDPALMGMKILNLYKIFSIKADAESKLTEFVEPPDAHLPNVDALLEKKRNKVHRPMPGYD